MQSANGMTFHFKKLDIFIAKQFGLLFVGTFFICQFVLMMQFLWRYIDVLIGKGLSLDILAQFFWHMGVMLVPQALPLAILLSSLITFGNLGESSELTAIKAAGISLMQAFRSLIFISVVIFFVSLWFQNSVGPSANQKLTQLLISMKQKSPELEIPEGIFYDGLPNSNLYVQKRDLNTGKLYGIMIYRMTGSYEDQAIILADSGMLQATAEKKHLVLSLWSGEWFENMQSQELANSASVPYRRESFVSKRIVLDYDGDFNMTDATSLSNNARGKGFAQLFRDRDSLKVQYDSIGRSYYVDDLRYYYTVSRLSHKDSLKAVQRSTATAFDVDSAFANLSPESKRDVLNNALNRVQMHLQDLDFRSMITTDGDKLIRSHEVEAISKVTLALQCLLFFFIGAPLGAIIRKGGLGLPVILSVLVFIVYYILDNSGTRMAKGGMWAVWFGSVLAIAVLTPLAVFVTYKATNDSMVFNIDLYRNFFMRLLGLRLHRQITRKDVIITDPDYPTDRTRLSDITEAIRTYSQQHRLRRLPNWIRVFFRYEPDHEVERIAADLEAVIEDLSNTKDRAILTRLNEYPVMSVKAHTRPFERKWLNILSAIIFPIGIVLYIRMWRFRLRLWRDLNATVQASDGIIARIDEMEKAQTENVK